MKGSVKTVPYLCILALLMVAVGCVNIFDFSSNKEKEPVLKAEENIRNGDYNQAKEALQEYIDAGTDDSMIIYTYAKATLLEAGVDLGEIVDLVQGETSVSKGLNNPILQKIDSFSEEKQTAWYQSNTEVSDILDKVYRNKTTGIFTKEDIALDYTISNVVSSVLSLRDTNQDGVIDYESDIRLDLISIGGSGDISQGGFVLGDIKTDEAGNPVLDENGIPQNTGLMVFLGEWTGKTAKPSFGAVKTQNYTPDDINRIINFLLNKLEKGVDSIIYLIQLYTGSTDEGSSIDYDEIDGYIANIGKYINYYWYDDGIDNDGDGRIDEETINGLDDDDDGLIDEDTDYHPSDNSREENKQYNKVFDDWKNR